MDRQFEDDDITNGNYNFVDENNHNFYLDHDYDIVSSEFDSIANNPNELNPIDSADDVQIEDVTNFGIADNEQPTSSSATAAFVPTPESQELGPEFGSSDDDDGENILPAISSTTVLNMFNKPAGGNFGHINRDQIHLATNNSQLTDILNQLEMLCMTPTKGLSATYLGRERMLTNGNDDQQPSTAAAALAGPLSGDLPNSTTTGATNIASTNTADAALVIPLKIVPSGNSYKIIFPSNNLMLCESSSTVDGSQSNEASSSSNNSPAPITAYALPVPIAGSSQSFNDPVASSVITTNQPSSGSNNAHAPITSPAHGQPVTCPTASQSINTPAPGGINTNTNPFRDGSNNSHIVPITTRANGRPVPYTANSVHLPPRRGIYTNQPNSGLNSSGGPSRAYTRPAARSRSPRTSRPGIPSPPRAAAHHGHYLQNSRPPGSVFWRSPFSHRTILGIFEIEPAMEPYGIKLRWFYPDLFIAGLLYVPESQVPAVRRRQLRNLYLKCLNVMLQRTQCLGENWIRFNSGRREILCSGTVLNFIDLCNEVRKYFIDTHDLAINEQALYNLMLYIGRNQYFIIEKNRLNTAIYRILGAISPDDSNDD